jgi:hypothetical protein
MIKVKLENSIPHFASQQLLDEGDICEYAIRYIKAYKKRRKKSR